MVFKVCRILYGSDGSFYVAVPYHPEKRAVLYVLTVNYAKMKQAVAFKEALDLAAYSDEKVRLKYSHHPDGFIQFSGAGVISGKNSDGSPKGIGMMSWPLDHPIAGPAFGLAVVGIQQFEVIKKLERADIVFSARQIAAYGSSFQLVLEGHYAPAVWRRFITRDSEDQRMLIAHPAGAVISARPLLPPPRCALQNFLSVEMYAQPSDAADGACEVFFSGSTGNIRFNETGEKLGDGIYYMFPDRNIKTVRTVNYRRA